MKRGPDVQGAYSLLTTALQIQSPFLLESQFIGVTFGEPASTGC